MSLKTAINNWRAMPSNANRQTHKRNKLPDEESFFNAMIDYFNQGRFAVAIKAVKTHQNYVLPGNKLPKCEISDVLFVVYSRQHHITRMTHMEVKKKSVTDIVNLPLNTVSSFTHPLSIRQYQLLHGRMPFTNVGNSHYPENTFYNPLFSDSIASYGVLYYDSNNEWNLAYEIASLVKRKSKGEGEFRSLRDSRRYKNIYSNLFLPPYSWVQMYSKGDNCLNIGGEFVSTLDTDVFEQELCQCHIGSHLFRGDQTSDELLAYINSILDANQVEMSQEKKDIVADFRNYVNEEGFHLRDMPQRGNDHSANIILINADLTKEPELR